MSKGYEETRRWRVVDALGESVTVIPLESKADALEHLERASQRSRPPERQPLRLQVRQVIGSPWRDVASVRPSEGEQDGQVCPTCGAERRDGELSPSMTSSKPEPALERVTLMLCSLCLEGKGGECHTPGCALWMVSAPDLPLRTRIEDAPASELLSCERSGDGGE